MVFQESEEMVARVVVGIIGGLFVFAAVTLILGFFLRNIFEGIGPWGTFIGWIPLSKFY